MARILQTLSVLALILAGAVSTLCVARWRLGTPQTDDKPGLSVVEKFRRAGGGGEKSSQKRLSPLVEQAEAFASYLNPPKPPKPKKTPAAGSKSESGPREPAISSLRPVEPKPKFTLVATSCYRSRPEESMALVSEPGREPRWVKQGSRLGHFVLERVNRGTVIYRDGDRSLEMAVNTKAPAPAAQAEQTVLASGKIEKPRSRSSSPERPSTRTRKPMHKLGPTRPGTRLIAHDQEGASG